MDPSPSCRKPSANCRELTQFAADVRLVRCALCFGALSQPQSSIPAWLLLAPSSPLPNWPCAAVQILQFANNQPKARTVRKPLQKLPGNFIRAQTFFIRSAERRMSIPGTGSRHWVPANHGVLRTPPRPAARAGFLPERRSCSSSAYQKQVLPSSTLCRIICNANSEERSRMWLLQPVCWRRFGMLWHGRTDQTLLPLPVCSAPSEGVSAANIRLPNPIPCCHLQLWREAPGCLLFIPSHPIPLLFTRFEILTGYVAEMAARWFGLCLLE